MQAMPHPPNGSLLRALVLTAASGAVVAAVALSPFAAGEGSGVVGGSIWRALAFGVMVLLGLATLRVVFAGLRRGEHGALALLTVQLVLLVSSFFRWFA